MEDITSVEQFRDIVNNNHYVFLDAYAEWCSPCKTIAPKIENLAIQYTNIKFIKLDIDKLPKFAKDLEIKYVPTFILFDQGHIVNIVNKANIEKVKNMLTDC